MSIDLKALREKYLNYAAACDTRPDHARMVGVDVDEVLALLDQLDYLHWFACEADFGPGDGDEKDRLRRAWMKETGKRPPPGWDFDSNGEKLQ